MSFGPTSDVRVPLSPPRARVLSAVSALGGRDRPVVLAEVAEVLGGHPNTSRQHLDALAASGLLHVQPVPRATSGRRPHGYTLTDTGRRALASPDDGGYRDVVEAVAAHHVATGRSREEASEIGEYWGERRASELPPEAAQHPTEAVTDMLSMLGFDPVPSDDGVGLVLRQCPLHGVAIDNPDFTCTMHEGMVKGVVRWLGTGQRVRLLPFASPKGCHLVLEEPPQGDTA